MFLYVDTIAHPAFVVTNGDNLRDDGCEEDPSKRKTTTFSIIPIKFLLRDRWGDAKLLQDYYQYGFKKSDFDKANERMKREMLEDLQFEEKNAINDNVLEEEVESDIEEDIDIEE